MRVYAYTITRANTPERCRLLLETLTRGRKTADLPFHWHVHVNGSDILAVDIVKSAHATGIIDSYTVSRYNEGQHPPGNRALAIAQVGYDFALRIDDDVEWLTKRWLAKLVESADQLAKTTRHWVISPQVKGLRWQPPQAPQQEIEQVPVRIIMDAPIGGICRLIPTAALREKPYVSDVRAPMGGGDATGIHEWACKSEPIIILAYCQHIRIKHARTTDQQVADDSGHFSEHGLFQHMPYVPPWGGDVQS